MASLLRRERDQARTQGGGDVEMDDQFRPDLRAHVVTDDAGKVRQVFHTDERWLPSTENPRRAAIEYIQS
jgi:hypothetical protein